MNWGKVGIKPYIPSEITFKWCLSFLDFPGDSDDKASAYSTGDLGSFPGSGRSSGEGNGNPLQYSCLENSWTEKPGRLQSMGSQRVGHDWVTSLCAVSVFAWDSWFLKGEYQEHQFPHLCSFRVKGNASSGRGYWKASCWFGRTHPIRCLIFWIE